MPYRPRRTYATKKVVVKPKQLWTLRKNTVSDSVHGPKPPNGGYGCSMYCTYKVKELVAAQADTVSVAGLTKKIKHLKLEISRSFIIDNELLHKGLIKMKAYLVYLPQGVTFSSAIDKNTGLSQTLTQHPEWILGEKMLNCNYKSDASTVSNCTMNMKLSKNLRSGDSIVCVIASTFDTAIIGTTDLSSHVMPFNLEWSYVQSI